MKQITTLLTLIFFGVYAEVQAQLVPGLLVVSGSPFVSQNTFDLIPEAGLDDVSSFFSLDNAHTLDMYVDPVGVLLANTEEEACTGNVFRYEVYVHVENLPFGMELYAKSLPNGGQRFPATIPYDNLPLQPLGPRELRVENGGDYILIPSNGLTAIKVAEFVGCRTEIPIQFRISASTICPSDLQNLNVVYSVVGNIQ